jgi:uncharacterized protein (TIGR03435 family)
LEVPGSLDSARYDIVAKVPAGATKRDARVMMQNLLIERLKLKLHHEPRVLPVYALIVSKGFDLTPDAKSSVAVAAADQKDATQTVFPLIELDI